MGQLGQPPQRRQLLGQALHHPLAIGQSQIGQPLPRRIDPRAEQSGLQSRRDFDQIGTRMGSALAKCARQAIGLVVEPLGERCRQAGRVGPAGSDLPVPFGGAGSGAGATGRLAMPQFAQPRRQFGAHRHRHFGGGGRGRRAAVGGEIDQSGVGLVPDRADQRNRAVGNSADHLLLVERPQILDRPTPARDDDQVGARHRPVLDQPVEPANRRRYLGRRALALDRHRPDDDMGRKTIGQPVQYVANHRSGRRRHHPDHARQIGQGPLARFVEQPLGGQGAAALVEQRHQRAFAGQLHPADHHLVFRAAGVSGQLAGDNHLGAILGAEGEAGGRTLPHHRVDARRLVLQREIAMARGMAFPPRNLAAHPHPVERRLDRALQCRRQVADRQRR